MVIWRIGGVSERAMQGTNRVGTGRRGVRAATRWGWIIVLALWGAAVAASPAAGQRLFERLERRLEQAGVPLRPDTDLVTLEAFAGEPFGVGRVSVTLSRERIPEPLGYEGVGVSDDAGRVLYPVADTEEVPEIVRGIFAEARRPVGRFIGELIDHPSTTVYFLFRGSEPFTLTLEAREPLTVRAVPRRDPNGHSRLLAAWWAHYSAEPSPSLIYRPPDYPPLVENYLRTLLATRLGLMLPEPREKKSWQEQLEEEIGLLATTEPLRVAVQRDRMTGRIGSGEQAELPLPEPLPAPPLQFHDEGGEEPAVEPIALRVPEECIYIRFGSFSNFLWLQDTLKRWGGDLSNLVSLRGLDRGMGRRMEEQLVLEQSALSRMIGPTVVADVAMIGTDLSMNEGAAFGILFQARNNFLFARDLAGQRSARLAKGDGVREETVELAGEEVSLLLSEDGRVRSYYARSGDYHLVTTSAYVARRFLEAAAGEGSLGRSAEFHHARRQMPLDRDDTVFVYASDAFFRHLTSPHYRIEMARRLQAVADVELAQLALLAAATEGDDAATIEALSAAGFLPVGFEELPDGSRTELLPDGAARNSLRGHRGALVPIPDMAVEQVTAGEREAYERFADFYVRQWNGRLDPMMVGIRREEIGRRRERVTIDLMASPFARSHYERLAGRVGAADASRLATVEGDVAAGEVLLDNQRLFAGLADVRPPVGLVDGRMAIAGRLQDALVGYLGTDGPAGLLQAVDLLIVSRPDQEGYARALPPLRLWRRRAGPFTVYSFHREVLADVTPQLHLEEAERPAQLRLRIDDLSETGLFGAVNMLGFLRTRDTSLSNLRLLRALEQQLRIPAPYCRDAAELLLDATLHCPLGGEYVFHEEGDGYWTSTALKTGRTAFDVELPPDYVSPPLNWFRGLSLEAVLVENALSAHLVVEMAY